MPALGRGGAGNIEAISSANKKISADLERAQQTAESYAGTSHDALHTQEYAHMGRGGAGNYYSPRTLNATGEFTGAGTSHVLGDGTPAPEKKEEKEVEKVASSGKAYSGRGGAGNYSFGVDEGQERRLRAKYEEEDRKKKELKEMVEKGVEESLSRPEKARLSGGEPF